MGAFDRVRLSQTSKDTIKEPTEWLKTYGTALDYLQTKQTNVLNQKAEIEAAGSLFDVDENDRDEWTKYKSKVDEQLSTYSDDDYVGNMETPIKKQALQFKKVAKGFEENALRRQKYLAKGQELGLSNEDITRYINASEGEKKLTYDEKFGFSNKFTGIALAKKPDVHDFIKKNIENKPLQKTTIMQGGLMTDVELRDTRSAEAQRGIKASLFSDPEFSTYVESQKYLIKSEASRMKDSDIEILSQNPKLVEYMRENKITDFREGYYQKAVDEKINSIVQPALELASQHHVMNDSKKYDPLYLDQVKSQRDLATSKEMALFNDAIKDGNDKKENEGMGGTQVRSEVMINPGLNVNPETKELEKRGWWQRYFVDKLTGNNDPLKDEYDITVSGRKKLEADNSQYKALMKRAQGGDKNAVKSMRQIEEQSKDSLLTYFKGRTTKSNLVEQPFIKKADRDAEHEQLFGTTGQGGYVDALRIFPMDGGKFGEPTSWNNIRASMDVSSDDLKKVEGNLSGLITITGYAKEPIGEAGTGVYAIIRDPESPNDPAKNRKVFIERDPGSMRDEQGQQVLMKRVAKMAEDQIIFNPTEKGINSFGNKVVFKDGRNGTGIYSFYNGESLLGKMVKDKNGELTFIK